jgi:hypothetical protein
MDLSKLLVRGMLVLGQLFMLMDLSHLLLAHLCFYFYCEQTHGTTYTVVLTTAENVCRVFSLKSTAKTLPCILVVHPVK